MDFYEFRIAEKIITNTCILLDCVLREYYVSLFVVLISTGAADLVCYTSEFIIKSCT